MKISAKLILLTAVALIVTSGVIGTVAVLQINRTGVLAVEQIEYLGSEQDASRSVTAAAEDGHWG